MHQSLRKFLSTRVAPLAVLASALLPSTRASAAVDDVFVASGNGNAVIRVTPDGTAAPFGTGVSLTDPIALTFDAAGYLYVANATAGTIVRYTPEGVGTTFSIDPAIHKVLGMTFDRSGNNLYVANSDVDNNILRIDLAGRVGVFFDGSTGTTIKNPTGLAFDDAGNLYVANTGLKNIVRITPAGVASEFVAAGTGGLGVPVGVAVDFSNNVYTCSLASGTSGAILRFTQAGASSIFNNTAVRGPVALAFNAEEILYVANASDNTVTQIARDGTGTPFGTDIGVDGIGGLAVSFGPSGNTDHPSFFSGEIFIANNGYYLNATNAPFGYYTYLADPRYIYHSDLGFEFLYDAGNSARGVYLYDFASDSFFYTSPALFPYLYDFSLNAVLYYYPDTTATAPHIYGSGDKRYFYNFGTSEIITK